MTGIYVVEVADWLRAIGITVVEVDGWETRARSSGGFPAPGPLGVQWHHTASQASPESDTNYMFKTAQDRPIGNMLLARDGSAWIGAAGAANTAGKGGPLTLSRGTVKQDGANAVTWAIEAANNGVGESWPQVQIDAYFAISNEINRRFGNTPTDIFNHYTWTPGRKIDPATAGAVQGAWQPRSLNSSGTWHQDDVNAEATRRASSPTPTPPDPGPQPVEDAMLFLCAVNLGTNDSPVMGDRYVGNGVQSYVLTDEEFDVIGDRIESGDRRWLNPNNLQPIVDRNKLPLIYTKRITGLVGKRM